jgi:hypothetical protein
MEPADYSRDSVVCVVEYSRRFNVDQRIRCSSKKKRSVWHNGYGPFSSLSPSDTVINHFEIGMIMKRLFSMLSKTSSKYAKSVIKSRLA